MNRTLFNDLSLGYYIQFPEQLFSNIIVEYYLYRFKVIITYQLNYHYYVCIYLHYIYFLWYKTFLWNHESQTLFRVNSFVIDVIF